MPTSKALRNTPETAPTSESDQRPYLLADRTNLAVKAASVTVSSPSTPVQLTAALARRRKVYIKSAAGNPNVYVGGSGVTSTTCSGRRKSSGSTSRPTPLSTPSWAPRGAPTCACWRRVFDSSQQRDLVRRGRPRPAQPRGQVGEARAVLGRH